MGGLILKIKGYPQTIEWNAHSLIVANFMMLGDDDEPIKLIGEGKGDDHDGEIIFDPEKNQIIINTIYFKMPERAIRFWRGLGFDIVLQKTRERGDMERGI